MLSLALLLASTFAAPLSTLLPLNPPPSAQPFQGPKLAFVTPWYASLAHPGIHVAMIIQCEVPRIWTWYLQPGSRSTISKNEANST